ncbi:hypothetical protein CHS0354_038365 [Potamilus streckersoni]|uniref:Uncharacterized protein n=1 Tax=Potamilus streckersoni TaxID=2493646 RepID=A0AAE0VR09_9BIVA|nr:hypothetical protein CHS0354_038365 [Potamilus streckersoni]
MAEHIANQLYADSSIIMLLYDELENSKEIRKCVIDGVIDASLLKPKLILDKFQVIVAATRAIHNQKHEKMTTKTIHSEILFCLSPSKNISDSYRNFGLGEEDKCILVVIVDDQDNSKLNALQQLIKGRQLPLSDLHSTADTSAIKKIYKIRDEELEVCSLLDAVVTRISSKEIVTL